MGRQNSSRQGQGLASLVSLTIILFLAFAFRVHRLGVQSLWYDEGVSVVLAKRDLLTIAQDTATDIHPPLYYFGLHFWEALAGDGEFAARFFSLIFGILAVPLIYQLGSLLFSRTVGLIATGLAAASPLLVYYSQEARMYSVVTTLGLLSTYFCARLFRAYELSYSERGAWRGIDWLGYTISSLAAIYTHYFAVTLFLLQNVYLLLNLRRYRPMLWPWLISQAFIALSFLPWLAALSGSRISAYRIPGQALSPAEVLARIYNDFSYGSLKEWPPVAGGLILVLLIAGVIYGLRARHHLIFLSLYLAAAPLVLAFYGIAPVAYSPKFVLISTPAYNLFMGMGLSLIAGPLTGHRTPRILGGLSALGLLASLGALAAIWGASLQALYYDPRYERDNYRGLAQTIAASEHPGDGIILNAPGQVTIFDYYYRGRQPVYPLPKQRPIDEGQTLAELGHITSQHSRVWLVLWGEPESDPHRIIESRLGEVGYKAIDTWYGGVRLVLYTLPKEAAPIQPLTLSLGEQIYLSGYAMGAEELEAGQILPLTLLWQARGEVTERYKVFAHIIDDQDNLWGQRDSEPGGGLLPTTVWKVYQPVEDRLGIPVLLGTPPGEYFVEVGLYSLSTGQRLPIRDRDGVATGDRVLFGPIRVLRPSGPQPAEGLPITHRVEVAFANGMEMIGYDLGRLGSDLGTDTFAARDILHLTLLWKPSRRLEADYEVVVLLADDSGHTVGSVESQPAGGRYPTTQWVAGELVRDQYKLSLAGLPTGRYHLSLGVRDIVSKTFVDSSSSKGKGLLELATISVK